MQNCFRLTLLVQCGIVFSILSIVADIYIAENPRKIGFPKISRNQTSTDTQKIQIQNGRP